MDRSSQVSTLYDVEMEDPSLEEIPITSSPTAETLEASSDAPPLDIAHLKEEANKALGDLLATKSLIGAHWQKLFSNFSMTLAKQVQNTCIHQGSKGSLCMFHQGSRSPLLTSHLGGGESGSHSGSIHSAITCRRHSASQRRVP